MKKRYEIIDNVFNRTNYPDMIGQILDSPPSYANVRLVKEKIPMDEIFSTQSRMFEDPSAETRIDDFALKCIKEGYDKDEVVEGIRELYRQAPEVGRNIFDRAVLNYMGIKDKISMKNETKEKRAFIDAVKTVEASRKNKMIKIFVDI